MTRKRACVVSVILWLTMGSIFTFLPQMLSSNAVYRRNVVGCTYEFMGNDKFVVILSVSIIFFIPVTCMLMIYTKLLIISRRHIKRIRKTMPTGPPAKVGGSTLMFTFAMLGFTIAYAPVMCLFIYQSFTETMGPAWLDFFAVWCSVTNSWWNVVIYARSNKNWREGAVKVLRNITHPLYCLENESDVTQRRVSFVRQSRDSFMNA